jgi:hypothetical protein
MLYYVGYRFGKERNKNKNPKKTNNKKKPKKKRKEKKIKKERCIFPAAAASNKTIAPDFYTTKSARNLTFKSKEEYHL